MKKAGALALLTLVSVLPALASCTAAEVTVAPVAPPSVTLTAPASPGVEHFPMQREPQVMMMAALLRGTLGVRDGYLAVNDRYVVLWPHGFTLDTSSGVPRVIDPYGNEAARLGESIVLGGGFISTQSAEETTGLNLPDWPDDTCWLAGNVLPSGD